MNELLQDLRIALPGVQMLFGFLLTIPFDARFEHLTAAQRLLYACAVLSTALASAFFIAPSMYQRIHWDAKEEKPEMLKLFSILAIIGGVFLGASLVLSISLVMGFLFGLPPAVVAACGLAGLVVGLWYVLPLVRRRDRRPGK